MISATSLNAPNPLNKGPQLPLNLENGRMRNDSQKFLVPSLPVSARPVGLHHASSAEFNKQRRERSIINGTAHPQPPVDHPSYGNSHHHHHPPLSHTFPSQHLVHNGMRKSYSPHGGGSGPPMISPHSNHTNSSSPSSNHHINSRSSPHHSYSHPHLNTSPRKDVHSPMYIGEVPGLSPGASYSPRSSMPIPCSSPAAASSASPKGSHSHSPSNNTGGNYSPKLPTGPPMLPPSAGGGAAELSSMAAATRLYPGFPPPHPSVAAHLSPAFYASVAAAAASHSLPYPMFGSHFNPHSHSAAAASAYLDSFHSALVNRGFDGGNVSSERQTSRSRSPSPPPSRSHGPYHHLHSQQQQQLQHSHSHHANSSHHQQQSTSVTSLHNKLIESTSVLGDRQSYNGHHNHVHSSAREREQRNEGSERYSPGALGLSKGGPLGISGGIMGIGSTRLPNGGSPQKGPHHHPENLVVSKPIVMNNITNGYCVSSKPWIETVANNMNILSNGKSEHHMSRKIAIDMSSKEGRRDISPRHLHPQHIITNHRVSEMNMHPHPHQSSKVVKSITFTSDNHHHHPGTNSNNKPPYHAYHINPIVYSHMNGNQHPQQLSNPGVLTDSNNAKKHQQILSHSSNPNTSAMLQQQHSHRSNGPPNVNHHQPQQSHFLPPSPKKRSPPWNFAVPACPIVKSELPQPPLTQGNHNSAVQNLNASVHEPSKYLNLAPNQNHKPSNSNHLLSVPTSGNANANHNNTYLSSGQSAQRLSPYPASPRSGPSTPKSPAVHQVKFCFNNASTNSNSSSSGNTKENVIGRKNSSKCTRNDSSSSTSSNESPAPWPVEQMPIIDAFRRGSLIQLASGDFKPVEELRAEDFIHAAANLSESIRIIHCTVVSIKNDGAKGSTTKVTMAIGSNHHSHQVVVPSSPEQPFFVLGRGWSSLSPKTTERALQLSCGPLSVGDVCITLTKNINKNSSTTNQGTKAQVGKNGTVVAKGRGPAKSRLTAAHTNSPKRSPTILKNALKQDQAVINQTIKAQVGQKREGTALQPASAKLTKPTAAVSGLFLKPVDALFSGDTDNGPPTPKRRRWSAPEPETQLCPELAESRMKKDSKSATPPPSPAVPNKAGHLAKFGPPCTKSITSPTVTTRTARKACSFSPKMSTDNKTNEQTSSSSPTTKKIMGDINSNVNSHHTTPEPPIAEA